MNKRGKFVVFEGGEGSGKDTQIDRLKKNYGHRSDIVFTREPGGTPVGEAIRAIVLAKEMQVHTELLLFLAARAELVRTVIVPALRSGKHVICNRFALSTIAYQIYGREWKNQLPFLRLLSKEVVGHWGPDLCVFLDVDPAVGLGRVAARKGEVTRFDAEKLLFHHRVREGYNKHKHEFGRVRTINANLPLQDVSAAVDEILQPYLS